MVRKRIRFVIGFSLGPSGAADQVLGWRLVDSTEGFVRLQAESPLVSAAINVRTTGTNTTLGHSAPLRATTRNGCPVATGGAAPASNRALPLGPGGTDLSMSVGHRLSAGSSELLAALDDYGRAWAALPAQCLIGLPARMGKLDQGRTVG